MKKKRIAAAAAFIVVAGLTGLRIAGRPEVEPEEKRPAVSTVKPELRDIFNYTEQIGTIEPAQSVAVIPMLGGEVLSVNFEIGDTVNEGDVLCTIKSDALSSLKIQMDSSRINMDDSATALARMQALFESGAISQQALEQAQSAANGARLAYEAAKNQYDLQLKYTSITAPISGVIESKNVKVHDMVSQAAPVCVVSAKDGITISFGVSDDVRKNLEPGASVSVEKNGKTYAGSVTEVGSMVSAQTGLYQAKASLEGAAELPTGSRAKLELVKKSEKNKLSIPVSAVYYSGNQPFVYILRDNKAVKQEFESGIYDDEYMAVESGINASDYIIYTWNSEIYDGVEVRNTDDIQAPAQEEAAESGSGAADDTSGANVEAETK